MKPLVLTGWLIPDFIKSNFADLAVHFPFHFVWGQLPSPDELAAYLGLRTDHRPGRHWSDFALGWEQSKNRDDRGLSLIEFCRQYETVELWFDTRPNAQLLLVWLLEHFQSYHEVVERLELRLLDLDLMYVAPGEFSKLRQPVTKVTEAELETARMAWLAYREPTPEACFGLLREDLGALPLLKPVLRDLLEELPSSSTGLGATEMRMLELIKRGYERTNALFHLRELRPASSTNGSMAICSTGSHLVPRLQWQVSTTNCARSVEKIWARVIPFISEAASRSPSSVKLSLPTRQTSAATIRSIAGAAART